MFNKWQAQRWWAENYDKVMELFNVQRFDQQAVPLPTPPISEDGIESARGSPVTPPLTKECLLRHFHHPIGMGYSSSDSLEHRHMQSQPCKERSGLASTQSLQHLRAMATPNSATGSICYFVRIPNDMKKKTPASFEPSIDYVVIKDQVKDLVLVSVTDSNLSIPGIYLVHDFVSAKEEEVQHYGYEFCYEFCYAI